MPRAQNQTQSTSNSPSPLVDQGGSPSAQATPTPMPTEAEVRADDLESGEDPDEGRDGRIRRAAYAAFLRRGDQPGNELDDWLEAERSVDAQADGDAPDAQQR